MATKKLANYLLVFLINHVFCIINGNFYQLIHGSLPGTSYSTLYVHLYLVVNIIVSYLIIIY